jgi:hypothetical protein
MKRKDASSIIYLKTINVRLGFKKMLQYNEIYIKTWYINRWLKQIPSNNTSSRFLKQNKGLDSLLWKFSVDSLQITPLSQPPLFMLYIVKNLPTDEIMGCVRLCKLLNTILCFFFAQNPPALTTKCYTE